MAKDPVCKMEVNEATAKFKLDHMGKTYYFCSKGCMEEFQENPSKYVSEGKHCCY